MSASIEIPGVIDNAVSTMYQSVQNFMKATLTDALFTNAKNVAPCESLLPRALNVVKSEYMNVFKCPENALKKPTGADDWTKNLCTIGKKLCANLLEAATICLKERNVETTKTCLTNLVIYCLINF